MDTQNTQATLSDTVHQFPGFYALRPEWFDTDDERAAFKAQYPELVAQYSDCWEPEQVAETALA
jgi:hypothetical protein